ALVASGIERFLQLRHGAGVLAVLPPTAWWMLHQALLPLVYAILLIGLVVRGRLVLRKSLEHLHTP
ncbi:MAG: hypothetical protein GWO03_14640, partial [Gammaproteobacteria bacterium]|nr:hypothetical protein [Gammaproteobacteria bacterium]